ncbi:MAG: hypothetical protein ACE5KM_08870 [Planctomycetaceae bacterium]
MTRTGTAKLALVLFAAAAIGPAQRAVAQSSRWQSRTEAGTSAPAATRGDVPCMACEQPRFWIVSSRRCPQRAKGHSTACCRLDEFVYQNGRCHPADAAAFGKWLIPGAPIAVVVHGSFTRFPALLGETCAMYRWLRRSAPQRPLNVVVFTWPSDDFATGFIPIDINVLGRWSGFNGFYLARFLQRVPRGSRVTLIGHSHGARTVLAFLHLQSGGVVQGRRLCNPQPGAWRIRTILMAAAVDHHWLNPGERFGRALCGTEALLNMRNRRDLPLKFYPLRRPLSHRALGRRGLTRTDRQRLGHGNAKVAELDVTDMIGRRHFWVYYFNRREISAAISPYVYFTDDDARGLPTATPRSSQPRKSRWKPVRHSSSRNRRVAARRQ